MRKLLTFFLGMIVGAGLVCFAFNYHILYAKEGVLLVPKPQANLSDIYVDVRNWKSSDWQAHPELARAVIAHGRSDLVGNSTGDPLHNLLRKLGSAERLEEKLQKE